MIGPDDLAALLVRALERSGEPEADAYARWTRRGFARFASGDLGQHMHVEQPRALVRVARGRRVAEVATSQIEEDSLVEALAAAAAMAPEIPEDEDFPGFTRDDQPPGTTAPRYSEATASLSAERRVDVLEPVLGAIARHGLVATGALEAARSVEAVATSHGLARSHESTTAGFKVWALENAGGGGASGHGFGTAVSIDDLDLAGETERAIRDCERGRDPIELSPGEYDVVLEPPCVAELMEWLSFIGLGARELSQGSSPLAGRIGEPISGSALTVIEDPSSELALAGPFDREGVTRQTVPLVERGVARGVVYDRIWAARMKTESTGAALASNFAEGGSVPSSLVVGGGKAKSSDELVGGIERGLYVRRLHYVNGMLEPRRAVMTGLTRDGTFLVEDGKITRAVGNMRFTDSLLEAFERVDGLTEARQLCPTWWSDAGSVAAPAVRVRRLRFTGGSQKRPAS